jgi:hypothetical protein
VWNGQEARSAVKSLTAQAFSQWQGQLNDCKKMYPEVYAWTNRPPARSRRKTDCRAWDGQVWSSVVSSSNYYP